MNYCAVGEAFDNSFKNQIVEYERNNKNDNKNDQDQDNNIVPPGTFDTYNEVETGNIKDIYPAFFTAQGDYSKKGPYYEGTSISDLKNVQPEDSENLSFLDSTMSDNSTKIPKSIDQENKVIDHYYCINKIVKDIINEQDTFSMGSSENSALYQHVKTCKICKRKINEKLRNHYKDLNQPIQNNQIIKPKEEQIEYFNFNVPNLGYNLKEILVIILGGIILIFILDLLVKIGKKMKT